MNGSLRQSIVIGKRQGEIFAIAAYMLLVAEMIISSSQLEIKGGATLARIIIYFCFLLVIISLGLANEFNATTVMKGTIVVVIGVLAGVGSGNLSAVIMPVAFMFSGAYTKPEKILKAYCLIASITILFILMLCLLGLIDNDYLVAGDRYRLYLGFKYTTYLPNYFFHISIAYIAYKKKPINVFETIVILLVNYQILKWTDTKAAFLLVIVMLALCWLLRIIPQLFMGRLFLFGSTLAMPVCATIIILLSYFYTPGSPFLFRLNRVLSTRLELGNQGIEKYGFSLFGNSEVSWLTGRFGIERFDDYFYVDSSYLNIALNYGMMLLIMLIISFMVLAWKTVKKGNYLMGVALLLLSFHSMTDPQLFELRYDPFIIVAGTALFNDQLLNRAKETP